MSHDSESASITPRLQFPDSFDYEEFFSRNDGTTTLVGPSDLEAAIPTIESSSQPGEAVSRGSLSYEDIYWTHKPYAFVSLWRNDSSGRYHYYVVEPELSQKEQRVLGLLKDKLPTALDYEDQPVDVTPSRQQEIIGETAVNLMDRYNVLARDSGTFETTLKSKVRDKLTSLIESRKGSDSDTDLGAPDLSLDMDALRLDDREVSKINYYLWRDYVWYGQIDPIMRDTRVEDISCDGYESPVFVYHSDIGGQVISNVQYGESKLDEYIVNLAQRGGKGISKREPTVDATLPDGSRAQLTLGTEVSDKGSNFTIRQFKDVPFTPVDLINWETLSLDAATYLWLAIENGNSAVFAGGTASGKTTSLNAMSLYMPSDQKVVSIEDTRELELPQRNWIASVTRETYSQDGSGEVTEYDLLMDGLRQRPSYIIMGEVRGQEGRALLQAINTGHTTYTTFHADNTHEVIRRFVEKPINASRTLFEGVDVVINQTNTKVDGQNQRRVTSIEEITEYDATKGQEGQFSVDTTHRWKPETDTIQPSHGFSSKIIEEIKQNQGWSDQELRSEWRRRKLVLAYLARHNVNSYAAVAATVQAYMTKPIGVLSRIADDSLKDRVDNLQMMRYIDVDITDEAESLVPRPEFDSMSQSGRDRLQEFLDENQDILQQYSDRDSSFVETHEEMEERIDDIQDQTENGTEKADIATRSDRPPIEAPDNSSIQSPTDGATTTSHNPSQSDASESAVIPPSQNGNKASSHEDGDGDDTALTPEGDQSDADAEDQSTPIFPQDVDDGGDESDQSDTGLNSLFD